MQRFKSSSDAAVLRYSLDLAPIVVGKVDDEYTFLSVEDGKGGGIMVEREYRVERSCPRFPMQVFCPRRDGGKIVFRMEGRDAVVQQQGRRCSFLDVLRQGPCLEEDRRGKVRKVLGV